jgi:hypothetical protein
MLWRLAKGYITTSHKSGSARDLYMDLQDTKKRVRRSISMSNLDLVQGKEMAHSRYMNFSQLVRDLIRAEVLREERQQASEHVTP